MGAHRPVSASYHGRGWHRRMEYYEERVDKEHGPAMTQAVYSVIYSRLGDAEKAYQLFKQSYKPND